MVKMLSHSNPANLRRVLSSYPQRGSRQGNVSRLEKSQRREDTADPLKVSVVRPDVG